jgi:CDP-4-dehydro-6-deoxyglucose reductase
MTVSVTIQPSGHSFQAEANETILDSALRHGISLNYNCNNGSCGKCSARLVSGELSDCLPHDHVFKEHEKAQNTFLLCRCKALTDLVIEASEAHSSAEVPEQSIETIVHKIEPIGEDIRIIQLRTPRTNTLQFLAGQHVSLSINGMSPRNKSIASCPCNGMYLQFHVREVPGDEFSEYIFNQLKPREKVCVTGPYGDFLFKDESSNPIIFVAFDTGMAPIKSLIEHAIALDKTQPTYLYWLVDEFSSHYQGNYCRSWVDALDNFHYIPLDIQYQNNQIVDIDRLKAGLKKVAGLIVTEHPKLQDYDIYINGPAWLFSDMQGVFTTAGVPSEQLIIDSMKRY